jgi:hypothetical protein
VVAVAALLGVLVAPVAAAPVEHSRVLSHETFEEELCGEVWLVDQTVMGIFMLKEGQHSGPSRFFANLRTEATYTDPQDSDRGLVISSKDLQRDVGATVVEGTTYRIDNIHASKYTISTLDGDVAARGRGQIRWAFTIDTFGDDDPDNDILLDFEIVSVRGNPLDVGDPECGLIGEITD